VELARAYAASRPSRTYNLSLAGRHFAEFLGAQTVTAKLPFLPDLVRLEWQISASFHAFDGAPFDRSLLSRIAPEDFEDLRIIFQPSAAIMASGWPALDIWRARKTPVKEIKIALQGRPQKILVYRTGTEVFCELLEEAEYALLQALMAGRPLGAALEAAAAGPEADAPPLDLWFARWAGRGMIAQCVLARPEQIL
jgi:hypothetical protein